MKYLLCTKDTREVKHIVDVTKVANAIRDVEQIVGVTKGRGTVEVSI